MSTVIILGSSRSDGDTAKVVDTMVQSTGWDVIDLQDYRIEHFDYNHDNKKDDYLDLMRKITEDYNTIVFATPVYWYSMSGIMKVFFDRITDLLRIEKELGRKLRGKKMAAVCSSYSEKVDSSFWRPFSETANYLGMEYIASLHTNAKDDNAEKIQEFVDKFEAYASAPK